MKITQIIYTGFGGLGSVAFSIIEADAQKANDWSIGFIGNLPLDEAYPPRCRQNDVEYGEFYSTPGRPYLAWWRLFMWLAKTQPDAVLLHSINSILPARLYCWLFRARLVSVEHTPLAVKTRVESIFSKMCMVLADRVVLLTNNYRNDLERLHGSVFKPAKVSVIPNGIDTDVFVPAKGTQGKVIRLGMAARFSNTKRQAVLVDMMRLLMERCPEYAFTLDLAGDGDELETVRAKIQGVGLADHVQLSGLLDQAALVDWFDGIDIYLHASAGETLSTSLLQAMSSQLPIVASDIAGISNLLGNGPDRLGILVDNTGEAFAEAVQVLVADGEARNAMAARARKVCEIRYSNRAMFENYVALLERRTA